jgi:hypothetical protein
VDNFRHKNDVLNEWCEKLGRDPGSIDRTVMISDKDVDDYESYLDAGATHIILGGDAPFDLAPLERLVAHARD